MKIDLLDGFPRTTRSSLLLLSAFFLYLPRPSVAADQASCAMEQHVVDSWNSTVKADQDAIRQLEQSDKSPEEKLTELKPLNARLQNAVQHLQQAKSKLADCQKKTNDGASTLSAKPQSIPSTNSTDSKWEINGLGILTLGQPDPRTSRVAGTLLVQTDELKGIPKNTLLTMDGSLQGDAKGFKIKGSTLTKGSYLALRRKEDVSYEYSLMIEAEFDDPQTRNGIQGTASLVKSARYINDKGVTLQSFALGTPPTNTHKCEVVSLTASSNLPSRPPQVFAGGQRIPFNPSSPDPPGPGTHLVVFFDDATLHGKLVVSIKADVTCSPEHGTWKLVSGNADLFVDQAEPNTAELRSLRKGGLIKITYDLQDGSAPSEANIDLPFAGAEVESQMVQDIQAADRFSQILGKYNMFKQYPILKKMGSGSFGNYLGRPDAKLTPTTWSYNKLEHQGPLGDQRGKGAYATWYGVPIKLAKLSNFIVAYTVQKIGVSDWQQFLAQQFGTPNDDSAKDSWKAGVDLAKGRIQLSDLKAILIKIRSETRDNGKELRLWPNPNRLDNFKESDQFQDVDRQFTHPGFLSGLHQ